MGASWQPTTLNFVHSDEIHWFLKWRVVSPIFKFWPHVFWVEMPVFETMRLASKKIISELENFLQFEDKQLQWMQSLPRSAVAC